MLKQAIPPIVGVSPLDASSGSSFPPYNNLPQWSRVNTLARSCPPRPLLKDRMSRQTDLFSDRSRGSNESAEDLIQSEAGGAGGGKLVGSWSADGVQRARQLEHSITYLKQQHNELLSSLHQEVDKLKRQNQDLQFKLTLAEDNLNVFGRANARQNSTIAIENIVPRELIWNSAAVSEVHTSVASVGSVPTATAAERTRSSRRPGSRGKADVERKLHDAETEVLKLRDALREEKQRNALLEEQLENAKSARGADITLSDGASSDHAGTTQKLSLFLPRPPVQSKPIVVADRVRRSSVSGSDVQLSHFTAGEHGGVVGMATGQLPHPLTVAECYDLIRQLQIDNSKQALEMNQLRDLVPAQKIAPTTFLYTKGLHSTESDPQLRHQYRTALRSHSKKINAADTLPNVQDLLPLPTVKLSLSNKTTIVDRHKRSLHRTRLEHELFNTHEVFDSH